MKIYLVVVLSLFTFQTFPNRAVAAYNTVGVQCQSFGYSFDTAQWSQVVLQINAVQCNAGSTKLSINCSEPIFSWQGDAVNKMIALVEETYKKQPITFYVASTPNGIRFSGISSPFGWAVYDQYLAGCNVGH